MIKKRTWPAIAGAALLLAGCEFTDDALIPSLTGEDPAGGERVEIPASAAESNRVEIPASAAESNRAPTFGTGNFEPSGVTTAQPTGTEVGRRVDRLRSDLERLQLSVSKGNSELQTRRAQLVSDAHLYQDLTANIQAKLQVGTTPGNPNLVNAWTQAQKALERLADSGGLMSELSNKVANDSSLAAFILESVRATYGLTGAVDEDHRQLAVLEDETNRTVVLIDRLLNELNKDIARKSNYLTRERADLTVLSVAVKNGELFGSSLANRAYGTAGPARGATTLGNLANRRPLVLIRFDRPNVPYEEPVFSAVSEALNRRPGSVFDVVSIVPQSGSPAQVALNANQARRNGEKVVQTLLEMGLPSDRVSLNSTSSGQVTNNEVHIYVR
jgi:hypothetical protein